jgi:hypothetical protein
MITENEIIDFIDGYDSVLRCLAMSWRDAKEYRSVKQNAGQRMSLIETAIEKYLQIIKKI